MHTTQDKEIFWIRLIKRLRAQFRTTIKITATKNARLQKQIVVVVIAVSL